MHEFEKLSNRDLHVRKRNEVAKVSSAWIRMSCFAMCSWICLQWNYSGIHRLKIEELSLAFYGGSMEHFPSSSWGIMQMKTCIITFLFYVCVCDWYYITPFILFNMLWFVFWYMRYVSCFVDFVHVSLFQMILASCWLCSWFESSCMIITCELYVTNAMITLILPTGTAWLHMPVLLAHEWQTIIVVLHIWHSRCCHYMRILLAITNYCELYKLFWYIYRLLWIAFWCCTWKPLLVNIRPRIWQICMPSKYKIVGSTIARYGHFGHEPLFKFWGTTAICQGIVANSCQIRGLQWYS